MNGYGLDNWPPSAVATTMARVGALRSRLPVPANGRALTGTLARSYQQDYYNRVHVNPAAIVLGNVITAQQRAVTVWNAWLDRPQTLISISLDGLDGMVLSGQGNTPLTIRPLQQLSWSVTVGLDGAPTMDGRILWQFDTGAQSVTSVTGNRITAWSFAPNWDSGLTERLEWLTLVERGSSGKEDSTPLRE